MTEPHDASPPDAAAGAPADEAAELQSRLAFLALTDDDQNRLRQIAPELKEGAAAFVASFYDHLLRFRRRPIFWATRHSSSG